MCGRYTVTLRGFEEYQRYMRRQGTPIVDSFNVAPTQKVPVIRTRRKASASTCCAGV
jgi:putative SOS response-associated peptidase YedK